MFGISDYGAFVAAFVLLLFLPGPGNLALISSASKGGVLGGMASVLGLLAGDQILLWLTVAGVAAVLKTYSPLFMALQWLGAAYLLWLGYRMVFAQAGKGLSIEITPGHYFRETLLITLLNPKAILFYFAFFPQFIDPIKHQGWVTFVVMALTIAVLGLIYCSVVVWLTHNMAQRMRANPKVTTWLQKLAGICLLGFGFRMLITK